MTAFFTRSSAANIPVNLALCERLKLDEDTYSVSIPLGATINMAGAAITILGVTLVLELVFALVSVWRCSPNTSHKTWFYLARGWALLVPLMAFYRVINS